MNAKGPERRRHEREQALHSSPVRGKWCDGPIMPACQRRYSPVPLGLTKYN